MATAKALYIDVTWFKRDRGIMVISEKIQYSYIFKNKLREGIRSFAWCFIHTRSNDNRTFSEIFDGIKSKVEEVAGTPMDPLHIYVDFGGSGIISLEKIFPKSSIKLCFFHLLQALRKRARKIFGNVLARLVVL